MVVDNLPLIPKARGLGLIWSQEVYSPNDPIYLYRGLKILMLAPWLILLFPGPSHLKSSIVLLLYPAWQFSIINDGNSLINKYFYVKGFYIPCYNLVLQQKTDLKNNLQKKQAVRWHGSLPDPVTWRLKSSWEAGRQKVGVADTRF